MAYNPIFPTGYQPYYPQQQAQAQTQSTGRIYVQGEAEAKSYLVAPNSSVVLWDTERPTIYVKSADASGLPVIRIFDYTEREGAPTPKESMNYATKEDLDALREELKTQLEKGAKK